VRAVVAGVLEISEPVKGIVSGETPRRTRTSKGRLVVKGLTQHPVEVEGGVVAAGGAVGVAVVVGGVFMGAGRVVTPVGVARRNI
jgi:hypothetical protein